MSKSILLNTTTQNYLELIGNGRIYRVPPYQRDYSWKEEQWEDLWNDLLELRANPDERHYMGALVVEVKSDREFAIIDGQQRLATLSIIGLAILAQLKEAIKRGSDPDRNEERATVLRKRFIGDKDPASLIESSKLFLNENDDGFYQDYLVQLREPNNPRGLSQSNRQLWRCFKYYISAIRTQEELVSSGERLAHLLSETIARQLLFIHIAVDNELNAYTVFETLNARGLELSATDLLKNYLFSRIGARNDLTALQRRWRALVGTVRQERFPEFLRYHLLCEHPKIRTQRLFKIVRDRVNSPKDVFALMDGLERRAELFTALGDPNHEYWIEYSDCRPHIQELKLFRVRQLTPVLFAAWEKLTRADFARVLKLVTKVTFRHTIIAKLNTNDLEPVSHAAAKAILSGEATSPAGVFARLRPIYVDRDRFVQAFVDMEVSTSGQKKKLAKYILCHLEQDAAGKTCDYLTDAGTIEHILPENPGAEWDSDFPPERQDKFIYRVGNLALLEAAKNREIGTSEYPRKVEVYCESSYVTTRKIAEEIAPEAWSPEFIKKRQLAMANRAQHLWRSDFDEGI